ncbi:hypothetical protein QBC34DRAFT_416950 [Podospora aff. communis PSN243]|uniref:Ankyrin repeat protein n=1 Tax=Podospora aff. communis PSN243 TaxID=3040156 RepID=A0AAV9G7P9_9PEZI|nr:hypothetical protein QBC34DRAFT_416950 [Podospora aff. communis PSN243]
MEGSRITGRRLSEDLTAATGAGGHGTKWLDERLGGHAARHGHHLHFGRSPSPAPPGRERERINIDATPPIDAITEADVKPPSHSKTPATGVAKKVEATSKTQKAKDATSKLVALSKRGVSKASGDPKTTGAPEPAKHDKTLKAAKKVGGAKPVAEEPRDISELRIVFPLDSSSSSTPRVDVIAIHDVDESLQKAWVYRKRAKRRPNDFRAVYASGGINSHDGEIGLGTQGSPAPGHRRARPPPAPAAHTVHVKKKPVDDSAIERWLAVSGRPAEDEVTPGLALAPATVEAVPHAAISPPPIVPIEEFEFEESGMLPTVLEDDDGHFHHMSDDLFSRGPPGIRRRPTFPKERKKSSGRISSVLDEHRVPSVGDLGETRRFNVDLLSDRQSSDQGLERRVNWLSDFDMLPSEVPGARVMCYTYKGIEKVPSPWQYLTERAEDLIRRVIEKRSSDSVDFGRVPIVLIGLGFGSLIVQRAMNLMAIPGRTDARPPTDLGMIAGVILLDAPSPTPDRDLFPRSRSQETKKTWTQDWLGKARTTSGTPSTKIDTSSMWNKFCPVASAYGIPVAWHYAPMVATPAKPAITPKTLDVSLLLKQSLTAHRLSRFEGPNDPDYRAVMDNIKRSLVVKCATTKSDKLGVCLPDFLREGHIVDLRDQLGQTALHLAVKAANPDAVKRLLFQGNASVTRKDREGRSPLNIAVQEAVHRTMGGTDPDMQKAFTQVINLLMKNGARVDDKDNDGRSPWAYAEGDGNQWIRRLKDKYLVIGSSSTATGGMDSVLPPKPGPQREACHAFDMILAEVFLQKKRERFSEVFNFDLASVHEVIYRGTSGVSHILAASRPEQMTRDKVRCRWIHLPSNNEQWVHDLLLSMGIQDGSMGGQRHEGSRLIDRYMMPQARRYKHFHGVTKKAAPEPRPKPGRLESSDSTTTVVLGSQDFPPTPEEVRAKLFSKGRKTPAVSEMTRAESDAIVIFMPILGFEKHRHRKYLTQAFQEADRAMQLARSAREDSPERKPNLKSAGRKKGRKRVESSDEEDSASDKETSRLYPASIHITRAHEQVKAGREAQLLSGYLDSSQSKPVHCRRTLDQFSYYMLNSTEARDKSQVAYRWAKNPTVCTEPKNRPIVMVDQLWLWAFHDGTIVTSSPNTWNGQEEFNLSNVIVKELRYNKDRPIIKSMEDLLHLILKTSVDFFKRKGPVGFQFHECFQSSINSVSEQQGHLFDNFRRTTKRLHVGKLDPVERKKEIEFLFSLDDETELLVEIMDIQDELTIVKTILTQQQVVLERLLRLYPKKADDDDADGANSTSPSGLGKNELMVLQGLVQLLKDQGSSSAAKAVLPKPALHDESSAILVGGDQAQQGKAAGTLDPQNVKPRGKGREREGEGGPSTVTSKPPAPAPRANLLQNRDLMYETIGIVENNIRLVQDMLAYAEKVESSLENLLDLKQKHANGWEARFAREGSEESQRQGNIILVFTLVTAIFLPLSFITSFLALGLDIFPRDEETGELNWETRTAVGWLFGFSALISIPLIFLALYVNKIIVRAKQIYKQMLKALRDPDTLLDPVVGDDTDDHDSDEERTFVDRRTIAAKSDRYGLDGTNKSFDDDGPAGDSDDENSPYAPLFGRYHFHRHIPLVRNLWRYRKYRRANSKRKDNRWKDTYVTDYPLHYWHAKFNMRILIMFVAVLAYFGSAKHQRARARNKRLRKARDGNEDETSSDSSASSSSDEDVRHDEKGRKGVKPDKRRGLKRRKSVSSGYWKQGAGNRSTGWEADDLEHWSNQTRSRGSVRFDDGGRGGEDGNRAAGAVEKGKQRKLAWLRMRRKKARETIDEEAGDVLEGTSV